MSIGEVKQLLGTAIRNHRRELHISQEELADRAGLHRTYISDVERGARNPSLESIGKLARAMELTVQTLFNRATPTVAGGEFVEILLVEDDPHDIELTARAFRKARVSNVLHIAHDGADALDFLFARGQHDTRREAPLPGVILLDLNLPKVGGLEVLRALRSDPRTQAIPVVVLTASRQDRDIAVCRELGIEHYLVKPVGFRNFAELMPQIPLDWALLKRARPAAS